MKQRSSEWYEARLGKVTASRVYDAVKKIKTGYSASRKDYMYELACERLFGMPMSGDYTSREMQRGCDTEDEARAMYEIETMSAVEDVGLIEHPSIKMAAASPDGVVEDGLVEIKCPKTSTHVMTLVTGEIKPEYMHQMMWQMACTGAKWVDFVSYDNRINGKNALFIKRILRDDEKIKELEAEVSKFLEETAKLENDLRERLEK